MMKRIMILLLCVVFLMAQPFGAAFGAQKLTAELTEMKGSVQVIRGGGEKAFDAFVNMKLSEGDRVITGAKSSAKIRIDKDTLITLSENTKINISELKGSKGAKQSSIKLQAGGVGAFIKKLLKGGSRFEIKTPTAVMGVRGTEFFTGYSNGENDVRVFSGTVGISPGGSGSGGGTAQLTSMQQASFGDGASLEDILGLVGPLGLEGLPLDFLLQLQQMNYENPGSVPDELMDGLDEALERAARESEERGNRDDYGPDGMPGGAGTSIVGQRQEGQPGTTGTPPRTQRPSRPGTPQPPHEGSETDQVEPVNIAYEMVEFTSHGAIGGHALKISMTTKTKGADIYYTYIDDSEEYDKYSGSPFLVFLHSEGIEEEDIYAVIGYKAYAKKEGMKDSEERTKEIWFDGSYAVEDFELSWEFSYEYGETSSSFTSWVDLEVGLKDFAVEAYSSKGSGDSSHENRMFFGKSNVSENPAAIRLTFTELYELPYQIWIKIMPDADKPLEAKWIQVVPRAV